MKKILTLIFAATILWSCENEKTELNNLITLNEPASQTSSSVCDNRTLSGKLLDEFDPRGPSVDDGKMEARDNSWRHYLDSGAIMLETYRDPGNGNNFYSSTKRFNCYGFAWYMADKNNVRINQGLTDFRNMDCSIFIGGVEDSHQLIEDPSYVKIQPAAGVWIHPAIFHNGSHAMITTKEPGWVISKWGEDGPLMKHPTDVAPGDWDFDFGSTVITEYEVYIRHDFCNYYYPIITGYELTGSPTFTGCSETYRIDGLADYDEVIWDYENIFTEKSRTHNSITLELPEDNDFFGQTEIKATVKYRQSVEGSVCGTTPDKELIRQVQIVEAGPVVTFQHLSFGNTFGYPASALCRSHSGNYYQVDNSTLNATEFDVQIAHLNGQVIYEFSTFSTQRGIDYPLSGFLFVQDQRQRRVYAGTVVRNRD